MRIEEKKKTRLKLKWEGGGKIRKNKRGRGIKKEKAGVFGRTKDRTCVNTKKRKSPGKAKKKEEKKLKE